MESFNKHIRGSMQSWTKIVARIENDNKHMTSTSAPWWNNQNLCTAQRFPRTFSPPSKGVFGNCSSNTVRISSQRAALGCATPANPLVWVTYLQQIIRVNIFVMYVIKLTHNTLVPSKEAPSTLWWASCGTPTCPCHFCEGSTASPRPRSPAWFE